MEVRPTQPEDRPAVLGLVRAAFDPGDDEVRIVQQVWASRGYVHQLDLVAHDGGEVVGHVLLSEGDLDGRVVLGLAPLAVIPGRQRGGVGSILMEHALRRADGLGYPAVVLLGHISYYPRFGFEPAFTLDIRTSFPLADERAFMVRRLAAFDESVRGTFRYAWELPAVS